MKPILDACCGGRMMWHNKRPPGVVFMDCRQVHQAQVSGRKLDVAPDVVADFRAMPFPDDTFRLVVIDPPHRIDISPTSHMGIQYGTLFRTWREDLTEALRECIRVVDPAGFVILKWADVSVKVADVFDLAPHPPLFGNRSNKAGTTHWVTFAGVAA